MKTGVVIVNFNTHKELSKCLKCIDKLCYRPHKVIVVENGGRSPTFEAYWESKGVEFLSIGRNPGFAAANNYAIEHLTDCEFIALINPDAYISPDWLSLMLAATHRHPSAVSFASVLLNESDDTLLDGVGDEYHISGLPWRASHGTPTKDADLSEHEIFSACAAAALYRRSAFLEVGGFDEAFFCYLEDVDLGFRLRLAGHTCVLIPTAIAHHVGSATTGDGRSDFCVYHGHRNLEWTYFKNMPGLFLFFTLPLHLAMVIATILILTLRGQGRIALKAKLDATKEYKSLYLSRKQVQRSRKVRLIDLWDSFNKILFPGKSIQSFFQKVTNVRKEPYRRN